MGVGASVLHECGAKDCVHPQILLVIPSALGKGIAVKATVLEDRTRVEQRVAALVDTGIEVWLSLEVSEEGVGLAELGGINALGKDRVLGMRSWLGHRRGIVLQ